MYKIIAINPGSTSTKLAYYEDETCIFNTDIRHNIEELKQFATIWDQFDYRLDAILRTLEARGVDPASLSAVVGRGGHTPPIPGGVYRVNEVMLEMSRTGKYGYHPCDLGPILAGALSDRYGMPAMIVDPPTTDEFSEIAKVTGLPGVRRRSAFHALNHRAVAKQYARDIGRNYPELQLIGVHMGGGISIVTHEGGRMVDGNDAMIGEGPFSANRCGTIPGWALIDMAFSGDYTRESMREKLSMHAGLSAHLGETDLIAIEKRIAGGDEHAREILDAMCYQIAKSVGAAATILCGRVDAIYMTGGMAHSRSVVSEISRRVEFIAPIVLYPGEYEMQSLAYGAYEVLTGAEPLKELTEEA